MCMIAFDFARICSKLFRFVRLLVFFSLFSILTLNEGRKMIVVCVFLVCILFEFQMTVLLMVSCFTLYFFFFDSVRVLNCWCSSIVHNSHIHTHSHTFQQKPMNFCCQSILFVFVLFVWIVFSVFYFLSVKRVGFFV